MRMRMRERMRERNTKSEINVLSLLWADLVLLKYKLLNGSSQKDISETHRSSFLHFFLLFSFLLFYFFSFLFIISPYSVDLFYLVCAAIDVVLHSERTIWVRPIFPLSGNERKKARNNLSSEILHVIQIVLPILLH